MVPIVIESRSGELAGDLIVPTQPVGVVSILAVVSRGGRPDLAGDALHRVQAPTSLIVGSLDVQVLDLNRQAIQELTATSRIEVVPGATHLFEEPGALEEAARLAAGWFHDHAPA